MTKDQSANFYSGLKKIELAFPELREACTDLRQCVLVFSDPVSKTFNLKQLKCIDPRSEAWIAIQELFKATFKVTDSHSCKNC